MPTAHISIVVNHFFVPDPLRQGDADYLFTDDTWMRVAPAPGGWFVSVLVLVDVELDLTAETALFNQIFDYDAYTRG
ncbi:hypothetical protein AURDEDRAFT_176968 [Auricularia subglabra TFB-10046 SS5]|uniref:Uncharacterized protein n=1 Tax=Auricularia subglabra (strain TFB-10046 / SS5) TaxID=717982 RepID=J0D5E4_AURST|nr:hypothetical protein AURDEDRAFT_176968 [Auricularia subglabra TFB-10046 SS5]